MSNYSNLLIKFNYLTQSFGNKKDHTEYQKLQPSTVVRYQHNNSLRKISRCYLFQYRTPLMSRNICEAREAGAHLSETRASLFSPDNQSQQHSGPRDPPARRSGLRTRRRSLKQHDIPHHTMNTGIMHLKDRKREAPFCEACFSVFPAYSKPTADCGKTTHH